MKQVFTISPILLLASLFCLSANAVPTDNPKAEAIHHSPFTIHNSNEGVYFWQESNCLTKCVYECTGTSKGLHPFTDYQLTQPNKGKIVFRVYNSPERKPAFITMAPNGVRTCSDKNLIDESLIREVNIGTVSLYLVEKTNRGYWIRLVDEVIRIQENNGLLRYDSPTMAFEYNPSFQYDLGHDLRPDREKGGMFFYTGNEALQCNPQYGFRSYDGDYAIYTDMNFVPGIGLYSMVRGGQKLQLTSVNDWPIATHLALECAKQAVESNGGVAPILPKEYDYLATPNMVKKGDLSFVGATANPQTKVNSPQVPTAGLAYQPTTQGGDTVEPDGYHTVITGESLYILSQRYNITMKRLRELNGLKDNTIYMLQRIKVVDDSPVVPSYYEAMNKVPRKHVVKKGDNLYRLSLKYNTTVERLIALNQLTTIALEVEQELVIDDFATANR